MQKSIFFLLIVVTSLALPSAANEKSLPKVIAPDFIVQSIEQGEFLDNPADPRHFKRSDTVGKKCGLFGWRMKVKTTRKQILVQERGTEQGETDALPMHREPKYGYLFAAREIVLGVSPGKYSSKVFIENVPVKTFTWTVK